ncbi:stage III sporulation protein SpoIIIAB [Caldisalinibacter kiritimatiensis]|uniref:Stage III sporulation protein AB n=1 Tax=Caldisalinibacter kiritimatiensis TaxID=1304284 RepID=R1ASY0_9FIRM|nr:stage III sporulation protein SpoIIIAB [Caldisalinibacter kiritimatiensis]EOC99761.1 Stage III sporulation protein AB [Caldisalinibacter kiritimatiensis]
MLFLKIVASLMIISSCTLIGYFLGMTYSKRVENLILLQNCIRILETEIVYSATPLPEAFNNVYLKGNKKVSYVFNDIKKYLIQNKDATVFDVFVSVSKTLSDELHLKKEDIEIILSLGRVIGNSDRLDQQKHFKMIHTQLENQCKEAEESKKKNEKLYKNLGVMSGLAITIILF